MENSHLSERLIKMAMDCGAYAVGLISTSELNVYPEVRDMCKMNTCRGYGADVGDNTMNGLTEVEEE